MPTHCADAARAWRRLHLRPQWMKRPAPAGPAGAAYGEAQLAIVRQLVDLCAVDPAPWLAALRAAMREVPRERWCDIELDLATWDALLGDVLRQMEADAPDGEGDDVGEALDEAALDGVMYQLACGLAHYRAAEPTA